MKIDRQHGLGYGLLAALAVLLIYLYSQAKNVLHASVSSVILPQPVTGIPQASPGSFGVNATIYAAYSSGAMVPGQPNTYPYCSMGDTLYFDPVTNTYFCVGQG